MAANADDLPADAAAMLVFLLVSLGGRREIVHPDIIKVHNGLPLLEFVFFKAGHYRGRLFSSGCLLFYLGRERGAEAAHPECEGAGPAPRGREPLNSVSLRHFSTDNCVYLQSHRLTLHCPQLQTPANTSK